MQKGPGRSPGRLSQHRLFRRYAKYIAAVVVILLLISTAIGAFFSYREASLAELRIQNERASAAAAQISLFMEGITQPLGWVLSSTRATRGQTTPAELRLELLQLMQRMPQLTELTWVDAAGREQAFVSRFDLDRIRSGRDLSGDSRFQSARRDGQTAGPVYFRLDTEPYLSVALAGDSTDGPVLLAEISLRFVRDFVARQRFGGKGITYIVDERGRLISHPDISLVLRNTRMADLPHVKAALDGRSSPQLTFDSARNIDGTAVLAAAARVPVLRWTVFAESPRSEALAPVYALLARTALLMVLGIGVAVAASLLLARRLARPIIELERGTEALASGRLDRRVEVRGELEALGSRFNTMAQHLQEMYETLEERIVQRTQDLTEANLAKTRFLAAASHDLRQPLHALELYSGQLRREPLAATAAHIAERVAVSVSALVDLFEALLDISRLDSGAVTPRVVPVPVARIFDRLRDEFGPVAESRGLRLRVVPSRLWLATDAVLLERILMNLVSNAVRYTKRGGIVIGCRQAGSAVRIQVVDSGIGIAPGEQPRIFQEFYQAGENRGDDGRRGLGLGLAIVERSARLLGHAIEVRSESGRGSCFTVVLDRASPGSESEAVPSPAISGLNGVRVLVIDDEQEARSAAAATLEGWGCVPILASGIGGAFDSLGDTPPDLVLCDLDLSNGECGTEAVAGLRTRWRENLPVAYVTGETDPARLMVARLSGDPILLKPIRPAKLRALLEQMLARVRAAAADRQGDSRVSENPSRAAASAA